LATVSGSSQVTVVPETFPSPDCVTAPGKVTETLVSTSPLKDVLLGWAPPAPSESADGASPVEPSLEDGYMALTIDKERS